MYHGTVCVHVQEGCVHVGEGRERGRWEMEGGRKGGGKGGGKGGQIGAQVEGDGMFHSMHGIQY